MKFSELSLHEVLQKGVESQGFTDCTPIQDVSIPVILEGKDLAGLAQTGTGKTAAYLVPLIERMLRSKDLAKASQGTRSAENGLNKPESEGSPEAVKEASPVEHEASEATERASDSDSEASPSQLESRKASTSKARFFKDWKKPNFFLILVPTRELATQVIDNISAFDVDKNLTHVAIYGGTSYDPQRAALKKGVDFVVATPGRLIDLYKDHLVDLSQVRAVVFDEADRMFDMGFKEDMKYILKRIPRDRQFLVFSATLNFDVMNVAYEFGAEPVELNVSRDQAKAENVQDELFHIGQSEKPGHLLSLLKKYEPRQSIIFSNFKSNVDRLARFLSNNGVPAMGISSLLSQAQRNRVMDQFKADNNRNILVATDVAARGLDIQGVDLVINYELPDDPENYVHRIGRTGRAGATGRAFSLVSDRDVEALARIEDYLQNKLKMAWLDDSDIVTEFKPLPQGDRGKSSSSGRPSGRSGRPEGRRTQGPGRRSDSRKGSSSAYKSRGEASKDGRRRNNRKRRPASEEEAAAAGQPQASGEGSQSGDGRSTHRDRTSGRHKRQRQDVRAAGEKDAAKSASSKSSAPRSTQPKSTRSTKSSSSALNRKRSGHKVVRKGGRKGDQYKGGRYRVVEPPPSVGQKVSRFFKKLFNGDSDSK